MRARGGGGGVGKDTFISGVMTPNDTGVLPDGTNFPGWHTRYIIQDHFVGTKLKPVCCI